jgi:hypothetical protein
VRSWLMPTACVVAVAASVVAGAGVGATAGLATHRANSSRFEVTPAVQRYYVVLKPSLAGIASASSTEHLPCYHAKTPITPLCRRLHAALRTATTAAQKALSHVAVPAHLRKAHAELMSALSAYLSRINHDLAAIDAHKVAMFKGTHESDVEQALNAAIYKIIPLIPGRYIPLIG